MADFVYGAIAIDLTAVYASTSAGSTSMMPHNPGATVQSSNQGRYVFARCASDTAQYDCVIFSPFGDSASATPTYQFVPITTTNAAALGWSEIGFCQNSVASSYYTWVQVAGVGRVNCLIAAQPKVLLYTTATAGKLDDATVSAGVIIGVVINTSATSASAPWALFGANPHVAVNGAG